MSAIDRIQSELDIRLPAARWEFKKLAIDDQPYYFVAWDTDNNQQRCLYYGFAARNPEAREHQKRVPLSELANAIRLCAVRRSFTRSDFGQACTVALKAGPCGFAVTGRIMELLGIAVYSSDEHCFQLIDLDRARQFVDGD